ncbi:hypothetical protein E0765_07460 [Sulfuricurvum sp. IAE1]|uniref:hypothetical protein n=1 Tax=Sulfuricurvum sp. IAE1 TaxID=2546102 RepID=UPI0010495245|nr:hypothetical protein [Sulfuricurvum sp. IAE1]TDA63664.1 hypothetical protein E0765_07460 [Sulfuricurvum sp. IAE1]
MIQKEKKITFGFLIKAIDKRWLAASAMLWALGVIWFPESAMFDMPLTLGIFQAWLFSVCAIGAGAWAFVKSMLNADYNK